MKMQAKEFKVCRPFDSVQIGTVKARNLLSAKTQAALMFGSIYSVLPMYEPKTPKATQPGQPAVPTFNDWTAGRKAALTKALQKDFEAIPA